MKKHDFIRRACVVLLVAGLYITCTDALYRWFGVGQMAFNVCFICSLPLLVGGTGVGKWVCGDGR